MFRGWQRVIRKLHPHWATIQTIVLLFVSFFIFTAQASAVIRFQNRSLFIQSSLPGATTNYTVSFRFTTQTSIGSVNMLFCMDPIPYLPCVVPTGLDVSRAVLSSQTGETGFTIATQTANHIVLTRTPGVVGTEMSTYTFTGIVNPTITSHSFAIRMSDYASTDASGALVDLGSVVSQITNGVDLITQVPPMLIFCLAQTVSDDCATTDGVNYTDMGTLSASTTLTAHTEMVVGTNASSGYAVTVNGTTMAAATHVITGLAAPTPSAPGNLQFGLNLRANTTPNVGADPTGASINASPTPGYDTPDEFMYSDGDVIASAPNVSLFRKFTVSYIVNVDPGLRAGVYTTTLTYICTGRF